MKSEVINAMTIDLEDWFCVSNMEQIIPYNIWDKQELRIEYGTKIILDILSKRNVSATFFVLGWIAEKIPDMIIEISKKGHEIATHGYKHQRVFNLSIKDFEYDIQKSIDIIETITSKPLKGYRAPSFSIINNKDQIFEILLKNNICYDSSILPSSYHPDYGLLPGTLKNPYWLKNRRLLEVPVTVISLFGLNIPLGGGYFRLLPYFHTKHCIHKSNMQNQSVIFYIHPWELDINQPRMKIPYVKRFRHYFGLNMLENKLNRLIDDFNFSSIERAILPQYFQT